MSRNRDNPATLLYWNDLEGEPGLKFCGLAGLGLWIKMLSIAARSREYGVVLIGDHPSLREDLPRLLAPACGETVETVARLVDDLVTFNVASVDDQGRLYNRRMVAEAKLSASRSAAGRKGADATNEKRQKSGKGVGKQGGKSNGIEVGKLGEGGQTENASPSTVNENGDQVDARQSDGTRAGKTTPSSIFSLSSLSSLSDEGENLTDLASTAPADAGADAARLPNTRKSGTTERGTRLNPDWRPDADLVDFARGLGLDPTTVAAEFIDYWKGIPGAKGRKLDWNATFRNRCRALGTPSSRRSAAPRQQGHVDVLMDVVGSIRAKEAAYGN